jgi:hypothetical protein
MTGRSAVVQGGRVQIASGLYAGEIAIVESVVGGVIPAAVVRTEAGRTRRVRTVDLVPYSGGPTPAADSGASAANGAAGGPVAAGSAEGSTES